MCWHCISGLVPRIPAHFISRWQNRRQYASTTDTWCHVAAIQSLSVADRPCTRISYQRFGHWELVQLMQLERIEKEQNLRRCTRLRILKNSVRVQYRVAIVRKLQSIMVRFPAPGLPRPSRRCCIRGGIMLHARMTRRGGGRRLTLRYKTILKTMRDLGDNHFAVDTREIKVVRHSETPQRGGKTLGPCR